MPDQRELPLSFPELSPEIPFIPVRMVNEYVYCPRLAYLEWVQGEFAHNADPVDGAIKHRRVDKPAGEPPESLAETERIHARSVSLSSTRFGITAKLDLMEGEGTRVPDWIDPANGSAITTSRPIRVKGRQMSAFIALAGAIAASTATGSNGADPVLTPGLYQVEVRISLPNVQDTAAPIVLTRCVTPGDLKSGQAFFVLSDNPLKNCDLLDYQVTADTAVYRIACPGPNKGSAVAVFDTTGISYRGSIKMNMGGKNMTMSETQVGKRIGDCH